LNDFIEKVYEKFFLVHIAYTIVDLQIFLAGIAEQMSYQTAKWVNNYDNFAIRRVST